MPTLFRLLFVLTLVAAAGYSALYGIANFIKPQPRMIVEAVTLPQSAGETRMGRSVAETLNHQATALVHHQKHTTR